MERKRRKRGTCRGWGNNKLVNGGIGTKQRNKVAEQSKGKCGRNAGYIVAEDCRRIQ